jgi:hypothetical protein
MNRLQKLEGRRIDALDLVKVGQLNEVYRRIIGSEAVKYTIGSMQPIDPQYTAQTKAQGERVRSQLAQCLSAPHEFEYQGSVVTDTHIRAHSDIDLLMIHGLWIRLEPPQRPMHPYAGDASADMQRERTESVQALRAAFPAATIDDSGSTAVSITGGSLSRKVDVVPASWFDTNAYSLSRQKQDRGVAVFDRARKTFATNLPFLHASRIEQRDQATRGGLRRAIRLMKTLKYDSEGRCEMSSYDITGIAYNIPVDRLAVQRPRELSILEACQSYCFQLERNAEMRTAIAVPNGTRGVFDLGGATASQLAAMSKELTDLRAEILRESRGALQTLQEAQYAY